MNALVVRRKSDGALVCFGPEGRGYVPMVDPVTTTLTTEPYESIVTEWKSTQPPVQDRPLAKERLKNAKSLPELITALQDLL